MILRNKKGAEKIISVYWFVILVLTAGTISYMVLTFYGAPYDVREIEGNILANKIADCLSEKGKLKFQLNDELKNNFLETCSLNLKTQEEEIQYYFEIEFYNFGESQPWEFRITEGNINLKDNPSSSLFLSEKSFYVLNEEEELIIKISSVIRKTEKNVG